MAKRCKWNKKKTTCYRSDGGLCQISKGRTGTERTRRWTVHLHPDKGERPKVAFVATKALAQKKCRTMGG